MKRDSAFRVRSLEGILAGAEKLFLIVAVGFAPLITGMLAGWWGSIPFVPEASIKYFALGGLLLGLIFDLFFLSRWVHRALDAAPIWPVLLYLFYSISLFGFFMGVPVFNLLMGPIGGYFAGMRLRHRKANNAAALRSARLSGVFTACVLAAACLASWVFAYQDAFLAANIQGMFKLGNSISREVILALSALGGITLVALEYVLTRGIALLAYEL
jgi:hypothetical protein